MNPKEQLIFELYKNEMIINAKTFKNKIKKIKDIDKNKIYIKILNYQVKKYGGMLVPYICFNTKEKEQIKNRNARVRKHKKINKN